MKLLLRQSCVFMLLLLQVFAPLVHAHIEGEASDSQVHIHNLHNHHVSVKSDDSVQPLPALQHLDVIIDLNFAIKDKVDLKDLSPSWCAQLPFWHDWQPQQLEQSTHFPPLFKTSKTSFKYLVIAPRAPPIL